MLNPRDGECQTIRYKDINQCFFYFMVFLVLKCTIHDCSDQFMIGDQLMVAPVLAAGVRSRSVYLPASAEGGDKIVWKMGTDGPYHEGGQRLEFDVPLDQVLYFQRKSQATRPGLY